MPESSQDKACRVLHDKLYHISNRAVKEHLRVAVSVESKRRNWSHNQLPLRASPNSWTFRGDTGLDFCPD